MESSETPVTFTKANYVDWTLPENQDCITENVCITRQDDRGIFNIVTEDYFDWDNNSPADTQWAMGQCSNLDSLSFQPLFDIESPYYLIGDAMCLHLISDNKYYDITFNNRTSGEGEGGGGFSYTRTEYIDNKGDVCDCSDNVCSAGNTGNDISGAPVCQPSEDACYPDTDGDGIHDNKDNCISVANPDQADTEVVETTFTKEDYADPTDPANQDHVTDNVWLTRGDYYPLYNIKYQSFGDVSDNNTAPTDTEWAYGQCSDKDSLSWDYRLYGIYRNL